MRFSLIIQHVDKLQMYQQCPYRNNTNHTDKFKWKWLKISRNFIWGAHFISGWRITSKKRSWEKYNLWFRTRHKRWSHKQGRQWDRWEPEAPVMRYTMVQLINKLVHISKQTVDSTNHIIYWWGWQCLYDMTDVLWIKCIDLKIMWMENISFRLPW